MTEFDTAIILFLNQYAHVSTTLDKFVVLLSSNHLLKGGVITALVWYTLFNMKDDSLRKIAFIFTIFSTVIAMSITRLLAHVLPLRLRPIHEENLDFVLPYGLHTDLLDGWNSMPSDHATLFFSLSMCLYFLNKKIGILAFLYTTLFICLPRIYLGLHYPTDIMVGGIIGISVAYMSVSLPFLVFISQKISNSSFCNSSFFYTATYLFTYQIADMFDSSRELFKALHLFSKSMGFY